MKNTMVIAGFIAALVFGAIIAAHAIGMEKGQFTAFNKTGKMKMGDPAKFEQARLDNMKKNLGLSDEQTAKLKALFKNHREEMKPLQEKMKTDMESLMRKRKAKASDAELKPALDSINANRKNMQDLRRKQQEQIRGILTPEQQAKMVLDRPGKGKGGPGERRQHRAGKAEGNSTR